MPWLSPLWSRLPRVVFLHHVHGEMWPMTLPSPLAEAGNLLESRLAPPFYRRSRIVTLSESSRREIVALPGVRAGRVSVVPPGISPCYSPGGQRADRPLVVAVGRLVPVKNFPRLIGILARVHEKVPDLETIIVGEGMERSSLQARLRELGADGYVSLPGRVSSERARGLVPPGVGSRIDLGARRLGHDRQRGRGMRDAGGCHADPRAHRRDRPRDHRDAGRSGRRARTTARDVAR